MVGALGGAIGNFQAERAVKRCEVGQPMRLKEWVGLEVAVFDFVERAIAARCMAERGDISDLKWLEAVTVATVSMSAVADCSEIGGTVRQRAHTG